MTSARRTPGRRTAAAAVLLAAAAGAAALCVAPGCDGDGTSGGGTRPAAGGARTYTYRAVGDLAELPWNRSLYVTTCVAGKPQPPLAALYVEGESAVRVDGIPGEKWYVHSEREPTAVMDRILWTIQLAGTFGEKEFIDVPIPPRTAVQLTGEESDASDEDHLSVVATGSGARLAAHWSRALGFRFGVWDASKPLGKEDWRGAKAVAEPRPRMFNDLKPGVPFVIAARTAGKQWIVREATLRERDTLVLAVDAQPSGGGTVQCENHGAELLIGGKLPIVAGRVREDFYRAVWEGVPPGKHTVRYPDGRVVDCEVKEGATTTLGR